MSKAMQRNIKSEAVVLAPIKTNQSKFPIVGVGASAGGLEAMEQFFGNMPAKSGMAFVVIQHLDPNHIGIMPELLQRITEMKVVQASDHLLVQPNHVYVIPPNKSMSILHGSLYLFEPAEIRGLRLPIDFFFNSLAEDQSENSVGVILSGMGSDGSLGLKAIKDKHGVACVQDPATAKFDGMPQSALNAVNIDISSSADKLPEKLLEFLKFNAISFKSDQIDDKSISNLDKIFILLRSQVGHDFSFYKKNTLFRRIERRMNVHYLANMSHYVRFLQENPKEIEILFKELLIGVTSFFRDTVVWEKLSNVILPDLLNEIPDQTILRAWVTGCSTGEEAYSLAIVFQEAFQKVKEKKHLTLQIFATDIDSDAIEIARKGLVSTNSLAGVSQERISKFFIKDENGYRVNSSIREMVVFAPHNMIKDPPFTKIDLLFCRNVLIYMEPELQKQLMALFHYSLNPERIMLLGSAENENSQNNLFYPIDSTLKIYKRKATIEKTVLINFPSSFSHSMKQTTSEIKKVNYTDNIQVFADQILLQQYAPASVLINSEGDVLYISGKTGNYIEPAAGKANWNIYAMAREGFSIELPAAIRKAKLNYEAFKLSNIAIGSKERPVIVDITFQQIEKPDALKNAIMIVFYETKALPETLLKTSKKRGQKSSVREHELEIDLQHIREELQSTREEMQTTQEELKSANEEMQSTNEELQSTNEELTTSKEEMQSLNEELQTVNNELQRKIADYIVADNDMKNLLNSTDIATLFLDRELNIRRFTDQLTKLFKLRPTDIGRPFTDMVNDLIYPQMEDDAKAVLKTLIYKETEISTNSERWFTIRIMPYRTFDDHIDGLVMTFIDITKAKKLEEELTSTIAMLHEKKLKMP